MRVTRIRFEITRITIANASASKAARNRSWRLPPIPLRISRSLKIVVVIPPPFSRAHLLRADLSPPRGNGCTESRRESCLVPLWTPDSCDQGRNNDQQQERPHNSAPQPQVAGQVHPVEKAA